jgi:GGDEF domain-containing protein
MISLRKFWSTPAKQESDPVDLMRVVRLLLQGIALHSVEGDPLDYQTFRHDMQGQLEAMAANPPAAQLLVSIGYVLKALEGYNSRTTGHLRMQGAELHHMIGMLTRTVATLGAGSEEAVTRLNEIEGKIERTSAIEDVRILKLRLGDCLDGIRAESMRQKTESARAIASLQQEIRGSQKRIAAAGAGPVLDPTTGIPARAAADAALAEWVLSPKPPYAALFVVDRIQLLNYRFGYELGDRVLKTYLEQLRARLAPGDQIFRWNGPAFLALLNRQDPIENVRESLRFAFAGKVERNFELPSRSVMLSISATWAVFPVTLPLEHLIEQLDSFLVSQNHSMQG